jgi:16S rRNA (cytidine1402-2'-O)-methyltransferase
MRLLKVLNILHELDPDRIVVVARELTKKFEEIKRGTSQELLSYWKERSIKGEIVLLFSRK